MKKWSKALKMCLNVTYKKMEPPKFHNFAGKTNAKLKQEFEVL